MKRCSKNYYSCMPICDFCRHYVFEDRFCTLHKKRTKPEDENCNDFHCDDLADNQPAFGKPEKDDYIRPIDLLSLEFVPGG